MVDFFMLMNRYIILLAEVGQEQLSSEGDPGLILGGGFSGLGGRPSNPTGNPFGAGGIGVTRPLGGASAGIGFASSSSSGGGGQLGGFLKPSALGEQIYLHVYVALFSPVLSSC